MKNIDNLTSNIKNILNTLGHTSAPRGLNVVEHFHKTIKLNPYNVISAFEHRPFNFKYLSGEFLWYLCGGFTTTFISKFSSFWNNLADSNGNINSNYGQIILNEQFVFAYNALVNDKYTRQSIMNINSPAHQIKTKDFPCTLNVLFYIRNNKLNMRVNMRSQDIFYGLQYDAPWYSFIMQNMFLLLKEHYTDLELGTYYHVMDNVHYYERHFELVKNIKSEESTTYYTLELLKPIITIENGKAVVCDDIKRLYSIADASVKSTEYWENYLVNSGYFNIKKITF